MTVSLKQIFMKDGSSLSFNEDLDLSEIETLLEKPIRDKVKIKGSFQNRSGIVSVSYSLETMLYASCARCSEPIEQALSESYEHILASELQDDDNDDFILIENYEINLKDLAESDLLLSLPIRFLCSEDCKGLCSVCGINLNKGQCSCVKETANSPLSMLNSLLK